MLAAACEDQTDSGATAPNLAFADGTGPAMPTLQPRSGPAFFGDEDDQVREQVAGSSPTPGPTPTGIPTATPAPTPTAFPTPTPTVAATPTPAATATPTAVATPTAIATATAIATPTAAATPTVGGHGNPDGDVDRHAHTRSGTNADSHGNPDGDSDGIGHPDSDGIGHPDSDGIGHPDARPDSDSIGHSDAYTASWVGVGGWLVRTEADVRASSGDGGGDDRDGNERLARGPTRSRLDR